MLIQSAFASTSFIGCEGIVGNIAPLESNSFISQRLFDCLGFLVVAWEMSEGNHGKLINAAKWERPFEHWQLSLLKTLSLMVVYLSVMLATDKG